MTTNKRYLTKNTAKMFKLLSSFSKDSINQEISFPIDFLKEYFDCVDNYKDYKDFIYYVIKYNCNKLNELTTMKVNHRTKTKKDIFGNKVRYIIFNVSYADAHKIEKKLLKKA